MCVCDRRDEMSKLFGSDDPATKEQSGEREARALKDIAADRPHKQEGYSMKEII